MVSLLTDSLSLYGLKEELLLLLEIAGLAGTLLGTAAKDGNPPSLAALLSFMQKFIHLHGSKVELGPRNDAANGPVQVAVKDLMLMSCEAVRLCGASQDHDVSQGIASPMLTRYCPA